MDVEDQEEEETVEKEDAPGSGGERPFTRTARIGAIVIVIVFAFGSLVAWFCLQPPEKSALSPHTNKPLAPVVAPAPATGTTTGTSTAQSAPSSPNRTPTKQDIDAARKLQWANLVYAPEDAKLTSAGVLTDRDVHDLNDSIKKRHDTMPILNLQDNPKITDSGLACFSDSSTQRVYIAGTNTDGSAFAHGWKKLMLLDMAHTHVKSSLASLSGLPLMGLGLAEDNLDDKDMDIVCGFRDVRNLVLSHNNITNAGLMKLVSMPKLKILRVYVNPLSNEGVAAFRKARPDCSVEF